MSDTTKSSDEILEQFFKDVTRLTKELDFFDAKVKVTLKQGKTDFVEDLYQRKNELELLKKSTDILLQRMENESNLRELKGRQKVDSGFGGSAGSGFIETPIQETECPNPSPSEHLDLSKNASDEDESLCSSV